MKKIYFLILFTSFCACNSDTDNFEDAPVVTPIELTKSAIELTQNQSEQLFFFDNEVINDAIYTSSANTIAEVSSTGLVTANSVGTATITVSAANRIAATVTVTVTAAPNSSGNWEVLTTLPVGVARYRSVSFTIGNNGYIGLGSDYQYESTGFNTTVFQSGSNLVSFMSYNFNTNTWSSVAPFPNGHRENPVVFTANDKAYIGLGQIRDPNTSQTYFLNDFWEYNPSTNTWTQLANFPGIGRSSCVGFGINGVGYVGLGYSYENGYVNRKDFWAYSINTNTWSQLPDFPAEARRDATGFSSGNLGYVGLGFTGTDDYSAYFPTGLVKNDFWCFNPENSTWVAKANLPLSGVDYIESGRIEALGFSLNGAIYVGKGMGRKLGNPWNGVLYPLKDFWRYNSVSDSWDQMNDNLIDARRPFVFTSSTNAFVGCGYNYSRTGNHSSKTILDYSFTKFTP